MSKDRNKAVPAVYLLLRKGDEILLMRRQGSGYYDGWYSAPAGHVEAGELPLGALVREVAEETGITIDPKIAELVHTMYRPKHDETGERIDLFFTVKKWPGEAKIMEPDKCDDMRWFPMNDLPENTIPYIREAIRNFQNSVGYSEST